MQVKLWASLVAQVVESACNAGDLGSIPGSGRSPGEGIGYPLQYSCLENPMDRGAWWATVHGVAKSDTTEVTQHTCVLVRVHACARTHTHTHTHTQWSCGEVSNFTSCCQKTMLIYIKSNTGVYMLWCNYYLYSMNTRWPILNNLDV